MNQEERLDLLIDYLLHEESYDHSLPNDTRTIDEKITLFRGLCNIRKPEPVSKRFINIQDDFLTAWNNEREIVDINSTIPFSPQLYLWQGDITRLKVDAIVNAANSELLGCTQANHQCIDNTIHTRAGVQLRLACHDIMEAQGRKEPIGKAKITSGYNLPASYVIHTVGPYIDARGVSPLKEKLLADSYKACLTLADEYKLETIAFCCISTGECNFPNEQAAQIAIKTVQDYLRSNDSHVQVIFNVFKDEDYHIYHPLFADLEWAIAMQQDGGRRQGVQREPRLSPRRLLRPVIAEAEAIVVGMGAGMSAATGSPYVGRRFTDAFPAFIGEYH